MFKNLLRRLRNIFITGLLVTLPIAFTIFILNFLFKLLENLSPMLTRLLVAVGAPIQEDVHIPGIGVVLILVVIIFLIGVFTKNIFGATPRGTAPKPTRPTVTPGLDLILCRCGRVSCWSFTADLFGARKLSQAPQRTDT